MPNRAHQKTLRFSSPALSACQIKYGPAQSSIKAVAQNIRGAEPLITKATWRQAGQGTRRWQLWTSFSIAADM